jgi:NADPH-dependent curcumin reductase CurA
MSNIISKEIHLLSRPDGEPKSENFQLVENEINPIQDNEVLVKNLWMSVDPYMRGRMIDRKSYVPPFSSRQNS